MHLFGLIPTSLYLVDYNFFGISAQLFQINVSIMRMERLHLTVYTRLMFLYCCQGSCQNCKSMFVDFPAINLTSLALSR